MGKLTKGVGRKGFPKSRQVTAPRFYCQDCDALRAGSHCPECGGRTDMYVPTRSTLQGEEE